MTEPASVASANRLLAAMPVAEMARIEPYLEPVRLGRQTVLHAPDEEINWVYFVTSGVASLVAHGADGTSVDTVLIGREGMVGLPVFLGTGQMPVQASVQVEMGGLRMRADRLRGELEYGQSLVGLLQGYTQAILVELAQLVLCNRAHGLEQRLARWLLQIEERVGSLPFDFTHDFVAQMVGTQRPSVTLAASTMRAAGLIDYARGRLEIVDREGVQAIACECYDVILAEHRRLLASPRRYDMAYAEGSAGPAGPPTAAPQRTTPARGR